MRRCFQGIGGRDHKGDVHGRRRGRENAAIVIGDQTMVEMKYEVFKVLREYCLEREVVEREDRKEKGVGLDTHASVGIYIIVTRTITA